MNKASCQGTGSHKNTHEKPQHSRVVAESLKRCRTGLDFTLPCLGTVTNPRHYAAFLLPHCRQARWSRAWSHPASLGSKILGISCSWSAEHYPLGCPGRLRYPPKKGGCGLEFVK